MYMCWLSYVHVYMYCYFYAPIATYIASHTCIALLLSTLQCHVATVIRKAVASCLLV